MTNNEPKGDAIGALECGTSLAEWEHEVLAAGATDVLATNATTNTTTTATSSSTAAVIEELRNSIARDVVSGPMSDSGVQVFTSPFENVTEAAKGSAKKNPGRFMEVPLVYCDQTASNRPLTSIERYISDTCLPLYGNTHTNTSVTGSQSTAFVAEARQIVAEGTNAKITGKASTDVVLFAGSGATSTVELLIDCLGIKEMSSASTDTSGDAAKRPVVFIGPYEHHSNLLPWRESGCEIVMVPESPATSDVDIDALESLLVDPKYSAPGRLRMGTFAAASNVNGKVSDVNKIAATLHKHGALAFFDYATGAPYLSMDMNPNPISSGYPDAASVAKDAIFISPHKMIGGINTPGILIVKKHLVSQVNAPHRAGGGTVFYVTNTHHRFLSNRIERYEGGTPNIVGIYRAGLSFLFKRKIHDRYLRLSDSSSPSSPSASSTGAISKDTDGDVNMGASNGSNTAISLPRTVEEYEYSTYNRVVSTLRKSAPNLIMLGTDKRDGVGESGPNHLPIFSFLIKAGRRFLHYNYVCALLNDLFGIQSRGGCQCSGPYSQRLLGLTKVVGGKEVPNEANERTEYALIHYKERAELLRPGYSRLSLPFKGVSGAEVDYVVKALEWVAKNGWVMMCQYRCNHRTGEWRHFSRQGKPLGRNERRWLSHYDPDASSSPKNIEETSSSNTMDALARLNEALANADAQLALARTDPAHTSKALSMSDENGILGSDDELEALRWYVYPRECAKLVQEGADSIPETYSDDLCGPIRPLGHFEQVEIVIPGSSSTASTSKPATVATDTSAVAPANAISLQNGNDRFYFRDGEYHSGEASLDEIEAGFNDGELSDDCEVFLPEENDWIPIEAFLQRSRKKSKPNESDIAVPLQPQSHALTQQPMAVEEEEKKSSSPSPPEAVDPIPQIPVIVNSKDERKKPSRDSSAWGRSNEPVVCALPPKHSGTDAMDVDTSVPLASSQPLNAAELSKAIPKKYKGKKGRLKPPPKMMRYITKACLEWNMIEEGDRLLLGLSGGKDSLSLLHCLLEFQRKLPIKFDIEVCTVDPMTTSFDPSPLIPYVESLGLKYHYVRDEIVARANTSGKDGQVVSSLCSFCARMKRGVLYTTARKNNCNKLVLAQHLDDCAESMFMSVMHNGFLRTMKAHYRINAGDVSVIRPMAYCRESLMTTFAKEANLPVINENCPACFEEPKERARIKKLLSREETLYPNLYDNIRRALIPLMHDDMTSLMRSYLEEALEKSRKEESNNKKGSKKKKRGDNGGSQMAGGVDNDAGDAGDGNPTAPESRNEMKELDPHHPAKLLADASEDDLIAELARRRAKKYKWSGASPDNKRGEGNEDDGMMEDPTGQVCSLNGGDGMIPCRELMP